MRRAALIVAVLAALIAPGFASAAPTPPAEGWGAAELRVAAEYWGVTSPPLCESTAVEFDAPLAEGFAGFATQPTEAGTVCRMWIAAAASVGGLYYQCLTVVHEYGHWMGLGHSADPSAPMAAQLNGTIYVRTCAKLAGVARPSVTNVTHKHRHWR